MNYFAIGWDKFVAWMKSKNWTAHSIAALITALAGFYAEDAQFRAFITSLFVNHPQVLAAATALVTMYLKYSHSSSAAGIVAASKDVLESPNPPTPDQVDAADMKTK